MAVHEVLPESEHRFCARHIYANWSKQWRGRELQKKFFSWAWSTFEEQFKDNLKQLKGLNKKAAESALSYVPQHWVRAYFSNRCQSWIVDNNCSESLNAWIYEYRHLPVIRMFEGIREKMMVKWADSVKIVQKWKCDFSPKCIELFESNRKLATGCRVVFNGDEGYEVSEGSDRHTVFLDKRICTCKAWGLTGIPCQHSICAMFYANIEPSNHISQYYHKYTYLDSYGVKFQPVKGKQFWKLENFQPMYPPPISKLPGRPPKKRKRTEEASRRTKIGIAQQNASLQTDAMPQPTIEKLTKLGSRIRCSVCRQEGHNKSTCKQCPSTSKSTTGKKRGRPKKGSCNAIQDSQQSQISHEAQSHPISLKLKNPTRSCYKQRVVCGMGIIVDAGTGQTILNVSFRYFSSSKVVSLLMCPLFFLKTCLTSSCALLSIVGFLTFSAITHSTLPDVELNLASTMSYTIHKA